MFAKDILMICVSVRVCVCAFFVVAIFPCRLPYILAGLSRRVVVFDVQTDDDL